MIAESTVKVNGNTYNKGDEIPDFGSVICVKQGDNGVNEYVGLSKDKEKLPKTKLNSGSIFFAIDTSEIFMFESTEERWHLL